jgi:hypothetical protein
MSDLLVALGGGTGAGAIVASTTAFILARRRTSGLVATTDADALWKRLIGELDKRDITIIG